MPSEASAAMIWWSKLAPAEQRMWRDEAQSVDPLVIYQLYWSRGPQLHDAERLELSKGNCPVCHSRGFVIGPSGAAALNVECASRDCRARFNVTWYSGEALIGHHLGFGPSGPPWPSEPEQ
jgi:hypothetical protein